MIESLESRLFLSFSDNLLQDKHVTFQKKSVDNFEIAHRTCSISVWSAFPQMYIIVKEVTKDVDLTVYLYMLEIKLLDWP